MQMVLNQQICTLIYVSQNKGGKMNLKRNLNIKTINIKNLRKTNRLLIENLSTRKPGKKTPHSTRHLLLTPNR